MLYPLPLWPDPVVFPLSTPLEAFTGLSFLEAEVGKAAANTSYIFLPSYLLIKINFDHVLYVIRGTSEDLPPHNVTAQQGCINRGAYTRIGL